MFINLLEKIYISKGYIIGMVDSKKELLTRINNIQRGHNLALYSVKQIKGVSSIQNSIADGKLRSKESLYKRLEKIGLYPFFKRL